MREDKSWRTTGPCETTSPRRTLRSPRRSRTTNPRRSNSGVGVGSNRLYHRPWHTLQTNGKVHRATRVEVVEVVEVVEARERSATPASSSLR